jgi:bifunctional non-homologous end joining protein LigD
VKPEALLRKVFPPMLATLADGPPPNDDGWVYELKYDGFRAVAALAGGELAMWSRNEIDLIGRFPRIAAALGKLKEKEVVLDAEIVALDEEGTPRFQLLQQGDREMIFVFDILWRDGQDLRRLPYVERRALLEKVLKRPPALVRIAETLEEGGAAALARAKAGGWEGIIAKRVESKYEGRRSKEWLKVKAINEQELVVVGWNPSTHSSKEIGSLHLAVNGDDGELHYAGKVGTGFSLKQRSWWKDELAKDVVPKPLVKDAPRERVATWVKPRFVVQVAFTEWTEDNRLRHPSLLGLREDKGVDEVVRERPAAVKKAPAKKAPVTKTAPKTAPKKAPKAAAAKKAAPARKAPAKPASAAPPEVKLTHPERILYPKDKLTKQDIADYYAAVSEPMIYALRDRPLALEHWNQGIHAPSWFHQNLGKEAPDWLTTIATPTRVASRTTVRHLVADSPQALQWLAQMSVLTAHMWSSRGQSLNEPDWIVFDLDPAKGQGIEQAIEAAGVVRRLLDQLNLPSVPKTSGKRGIHVFVPLQSGYSHEEANAFACSVAGALAKKVPDMTVERSLNQRRGRLYLDCMQNGYGKTMVAPYSPRAIDGAPVSAPLKWEEINKRLDPLKYTVRTMPERLAKVGDLFAKVFEDRVKLPELR